MRRGLARIGLTAAVMAGTALGCYKDRERLDVPALSIVLDADSITPGDTIRGVLEASDASGLILVRLFAVFRSDTLTADVDTLRRRYDLFEQTSVSLPFDIPIAGSVPLGSRVALVAAAFDDQDFVVEATDTLWVVP